jgi:hypothetical protein
MNSVKLIVITLVVIAVITIIVAIRNNTSLQNQNNIESDGFQIEEPAPIIYTADIIVQPSSPVIPTPTPDTPIPDTPIACTEITWNTVPGPSKAWQSSLFIEELDLVVYGSNDLTNSIAITDPNLTVFLTPNTPASATVLAYSPTLGNGSGRIIAAGTNGNSMYSDDEGVTWITGQGFPTAPNTIWSSAAWSDDLGLFVMGANTGILAYGNGAIWNSVPSVSGIQSITSIIWTPLGGGKFVGTQFDQGLPNGTGHIISSTDGMNWTRHSLTGVPQTNWYDITYSPELGMIMMVGAFGPSIATTTSDPTLDDWTYSTGSGQTGQTVVWSSGCGEFVSSTFGTYATSPDGVNWTNKELHGISGQITMAYVSDNDTIISAGFGGAIGKGTYNI